MPGETLHSKREGLTTARGYLFGFVRKKTVHARGINGEGGLSARPLFFVGGRKINWTRLDAVFLALLSCCGNVPRVKKFPALRGIDPHLQIPQRLHIAALHAGPYPYSLVPALPHGSGARRCTQCDVEGGGNLSLWKEQVVFDLDS